jgi:NIMA (never in mitosis gene a)-related kinase
VYAIKELDLSHMTHRERVESLNEVRILASVSHANIIRFCDAFLQRNNLYVVTEFAADGDLSQLMESRAKVGAQVRGAEV